MKLNIYSDGISFIISPMKLYMDDWESAEIETKPGDFFDRYYRAVIKIAEEVEGNE